MCSVPISLWLSILASSWARTTTRRAPSVNLSNMLSAALLVLVSAVFDSKHDTIHLVCVIRIVGGAGAALLTA